MIRRSLAWLPAALLLAACTSPGPTLTVGTKDFAEQRVLAHMLADRITALGGTRARVRQCGDTAGCQRTLAEGGIDLLVEYTGTARIYYGLPVRSGANREELREALAERGLVQLAPLGFSNDFVLALPSHRARALQLGRIADLARLDGHQGIRFAVPQTYPRRPTDGLQALLRFHGLHARGDPLIVDDPVARARALFEGHADVAVLYSTDAVLDQMALTRLTDSLDFFPEYRAEVWTRRDLAERIPQLAGAAAGLAPHLDADTMRALTRQTDFQGTPPRAVARRFLAERGLLPAGMPELERPVDLRLAVDAAEPAGGTLMTGADAVRRAFRERTVTLVPAEDPADLLMQGRAALAILGAEDFFEPGGARPYTRPREVIEAAAVAGTHYLHALHREDGPAEPEAIGISPAGGTAADLLRMLCAGPVRAFESRQALLAALGEGRIDAALLFAVPGDAAVSEALAGPAVRLVATRALIREPAPVFLRPARIAPRTYPNQPEPVPTLARQLLIAAPAPAAGRGFLSRGPLAAAFSQVRVLSRQEAEALAEATGIAEPPDPALPTTWSRPSADQSARGAPGVADTLLNLAAIALLGWAVWLVAGRRG